MSKMLKYMVVHDDPHISWRTCFNKEKGLRYCEWLSPDERTLKSIFMDLHISYESIVKVEETVPDLWGKRWEEHLAAEETASTRGF
jgi:hypothetical protein